MQNTKNITINVVKQPAAAYRSGSARSLYWTRIAQHDGKTVHALQASVTKNPPAQPTKGKLAGQTEPLSGWLSFFIRQGCIVLATK